MNDPKFVSRGFVGKRRTPNATGRLPPGQHLVTDFPVLSAGPTPRVSQDQWSFTLEGSVEQPITWNWAQFQGLSAQDFTVDIHCVTTWSKFDTRWRGVSVDTLLEQVNLKPEAQFITAFCDGGYTTNLPIADLINGQAFIGTEFDGQPLPAQHGGLARLVVPHLYFWKSAKWVRGFRFMDKDKRGFWESLGYHHYGDIWKEQRYTDDT